MNDPIVGVLGCGNMGEAIVRGMIASGWDPRRIVASHPRPERRDALARAHGIRTTDSNPEVLRLAAVTLLAVKPQILPQVLPAIAEAARDRLAVSLAAGTTHATIAGALPGARVVRAMPNQPAAVRAGVTGLWAGPDIGEEDRALVDRVFAAVGGTVWLPREDLFHALTALSACGPGFLYAIAEALADGGVAAGLPRPLARTLAAHTMAGAGRTLVATGEHPAALKDQVASPAGTTIAGLAALEKAGVRGGVIEAVRAAARRSVEMAEGRTPRARRATRDKPVKAQAKRATGGDSERAGKRMARKSGRITKGR